MTTSHITDLDLSDPRFTIRLADGQLYRATRAYYTHELPSTPDAQGWKTSVASLSVDLVRVTKAGKLDRGWVRHGTRIWETVEDLERFQREGVWTFARAVREVMTPKTQADPLGRYTFSMGPVGTHPERYYVATQTLRFAGEHTDTFVAQVVSRMSGNAVATFQTTKPYTQDRCIIHARARAQALNYPEKA